MNSVDLYIAKRVKKLRDKKELTPTELAKILGYKSHVSVLRMEQGKQSFVPKVIYLLCSVYNVTPNDLFPPVKNTKIIKQKREVIIKPKILKVEGLPKIKK
jgi:transcriptional regulator with XRE-family HTH domain